MSSLPLVADGHHHSVSFGVHFDEPASGDHAKSDLLKQRISEVLGPFQDVSPRLLSDLNEEPDLLYGIDTPNTSASPHSSKGASPFGSFFANSPQNHKPKHQQQNSEQKTVRKMGPNGRMISPGSGSGNGKRHPPKLLLNPSATKPVDKTNPMSQQRKPHHLSDMKSKPTPPLSNKHNSRSHLNSPNASSTIRGEVGDQKVKLKKPMNASNFAINNKRPDRPREREGTSTKKLLQSEPFSVQKTVKPENHEFGHRISPKEDSKPVPVLSGHPLHSKQPVSRPVEEVGGSRRKQHLNLALSLSGDNDPHDDSLGQLFSKGMEPLPTPLGDINTPVINKKFGAFPNPASQPRNMVPPQQTDHKMRPPPPIRQSSPIKEERAEQNSSDSGDSSDSEFEQPDTGQIIGDIYLSPDTDDSSDESMDESKPIQPGTDVSPSPPKKPDILGTNHSDFSSSDSSDEEVKPQVWSTANNRTSHAPSLIKTERHSASRRFSSPRDVKPNIQALTIASSRPVVRGHEMLTDDSDNCSPDRKRFKVSISLNKVAVRNSFMVSIKRDKIALSADKFAPVETSKQMARVQPIQRHILDSSKEITQPQATLPQSSMRVVKAQVPGHRISRKSPHNMMDFQSPDTWLRDSCYDSSQIITSTPNPSDRWPDGTSEPPFIPRPTKVSTSHDYLTEAKRLKHQADRYKSNYDKALYYCEAALSFMLYGDQLELTSKHIATSTYSDTFNLLDFVLRPSTGSEGGLGFSNECYPRLIFICLRCQSVIFNRIFVLKQEALKSSHKELHDFFSGYKSDTKAKTPVSNSPYADSQWSPSSMVSVPQKIANVNSDYLQVMEFSFRSMELWNKSQVHEDDSLAFIQKLNISVGKCIDRFSSIRDTTAWCKAGLSCLKSDRT